MKRALLALLMSACSGPSPGGGEAEAASRVVEPGDRVIIHCAAIQGCYIAANTVCEVHEVICRETDPGCPAQPNAPGHAALMVECK